MPGSRRRRAAGDRPVFAGYFHGSQEPPGGLINLAIALREGTLAAVLPRETLLLDPEAPAEPDGAEVAAEPDAEVAEAPGEDDATA